MKYLLLVCLLLGSVACAEKSNEDAATNIVSEGESDAGIDTGSTIDANVGGNVDTIARTDTNTTMDIIDSGQDSRTPGTVDTGDEPGSDNDTGIKADTDTGVDTAVDTEIGTGVDTAVDTAIDTGVDTAIDTGVDTAIDTAIDTVVDTGVDTVIDTDTGSNLQWDDPREPRATPPKKTSWTVETLAELRDAIQQSNTHIVMKPGQYNMEDLPEGSRNLIFSGSENTIDLDYVYVTVRVGSTPKKESYISVTGNNNTLLGGTFEDVYPEGFDNEVTDFVAYNKDRDNLAYGLRGASVMVVSGQNNLIDGINLTVRGSWPWGYGSLYGIGSERLTPNNEPLDKRCGLLVNGPSNTIDHVEVHQQAFCHGIYVQPGAANTIVRNSLVEGVVRPSNELYEETDPESFPAWSNYTGVSGDALPRDTVIPLVEDGIRVYTDGGDIVVENCLVRRMRGGIRLYLSSDASVTDSVSVDCGLTNFDLPAGGTITGGIGNFAYAPINDHRLSRSNQNIEMTILPSPHAVGPHNIADIQGNNHQIVFHRAPGPEDTDETRAIVVYGDGSTIRNETEYKIILESGTNNNTIISAGPVTDNGTNDVSTIPLVLD